MRFHGTSRNDCSMGSKSTSETPLDIYTVILRPPTPSWWSLQGEPKAKWRKPKSRQGQLLLQRCPLAQKSWGTKMQGWWLLWLGQSRVVPLPVPPVAQGTGVMGEDGQLRTPLSAQTPTMVGLAWAKPLLAALPLLIEWVPNTHVRGIQMCRTVYQAVHKVLKAPVPCNATGARAGAIWPGSVQLLQHS